LSHTVTKVRRATSRVEDPCLSVGSHSAAAFTVVFDHTSYSSYGVEHKAKERVTKCYNGLRTGWYCGYVQEICGSIKADDLSSTWAAIWK